MEKPVRQHRFLVWYVGDPIPRFERDPDDPAKQYRCIPSAEDRLREGFNPRETVYVFPHHHLLLDLCSELNARGIVFQVERKKTGRGDPWGMTFRDDRAATWMGC